MCVCVCAYTVFFCPVKWLFLNERWGLEKENRWKMRNKAIERSQKKAHTQQRCRNKRKNQRLFHSLLFLLNSSTFSISVSEECWSSVCVCVCIRIACRRRWISHHQKATNDFSFCLAVCFFEPSRNAAENVETGSLENWFFGCLTH